MSFEYFNSNYSFEDLNLTAQSIIDKNNFNKTCNYFKDQIVNINQHDFRLRLLNDIKNTNLINNNFNSNSSVNIMSPYGLMYNNSFITKYDPLYFNHSKLINDICNKQNISNPIIFDYCGKYGGLLQYLSEQNNNFTYINYDKKENLDIFVLYITQFMEENNLNLKIKYCNEITNNTIENYDIILLNNENSVPENINIDFYYSFDENQNSNFIQKLNPKFCLITTSDLSFKLKYNKIYKIKSPWSVLNKPHKEVIYSNIN